MGLALTAHRRGTAAMAALALLWGGWVWGALGGMWLAEWIVGMSCVATGATLQEIEEHRRRRGRPPPDSRPQTVMLAGLVYLAVGLVAGFLHPVLTFVTLGAVLVDFFSNHRVVRSLISTVTSTVTPAGGQPR